MNNAKRAVDQHEIDAKMGRNLLLFQRLEFILKELAEMGSRVVSIKGGEVTFNSASFKNETLGSVKTSFIGKHCGATEFLNSPELGEAEAAMGVGFHLPIEGLADRISAMVPVRNGFIHHFLTNHDLASEEGRAHAAGELDGMHDRFSPLLDELIENHKSMKGAFLYMLDFLRSPEGQHQLLVPHIQTSPLVENLIALGDAMSDPEGWTLLGAAIRHTNAHVGKAELERLNVKSAAELLVASGLFEIRRELSDDGKPRVFYRRMTGEWEAILPNLAVK